MINEYEINSETLALFSIENKLSKVIEKDSEILVKKNPIEIIDDSCKYFGSSYNGRFEGTKKMIGKNYKAPIIIEESNEVIFFPTHSPRNNECIWINLNEIKKIEKLSNNSKILFKNGKEINLLISFGILENQILRANLLKTTINSRKPFIKY